MFILYDLIFLIFGIIYLPYLLLKRKFQRGFSARLGKLPSDLKLNRPIWIHAVSVGEAMSVRGLLEELRTAYPNKKFVFSTVTSTGNKIAKEIAKAGDFVTYLPLDLSFIVRKVIDRINPALFIIAETEFWPNLIAYLDKKDIPIAIVNGRISDRSFLGYLSIKFLLRSLLNKVGLFCVQTKQDAQRLVRLGVLQDKIRVTGNMKFDIKDYTKDYTDYRTKLGLEVEDKLFIAGSTHPGEEEIILEAYKNLLREFSSLKLLIAPRHPERSSQLTDLIKKFGFESIRVSLLTNSRTHELKATSRTTFILDAIGQLIDYYAIADIVFVGGSLVKIGGHNILEPAALEKPILVGPYMFNFRDIADLFLKNKAAILVHNQEELERAIRDLLRNPSKVTKLSQKAKDLILKNTGATKRNLEYILQRITLP